jgi:hemerythrin
MKIYKGFLMKEIEWKRYYELGIKEIDEQHKRFIFFLEEAK